MPTPPMPYRRPPLVSDRQGFDRRWFAPNLEMVFTPTTADDVRDMMNQAIWKYSYQPGEIQITCGRHCYEGFVYNSTTRCIIDVTGVSSYGFDVSKGYYIDVGNGNWDMYRTFFNVYGRTLPAGSCYSVGLGGHITGGGYGILSRLLGLAIDYLTGADVVIMPGDGRTPQLVYCSASQNSDLYWAIRGGGGGNFGIITRYYFQDPPVAPQYLYVNTLTIPWANFTSSSVLQSYLDTFFQYECYTAPWDEFSIFHANHQQAGSMTVSTFYLYNQPLETDVTTYEADLTRRVNERRQRYEALGPLSDRPGQHIGHPGWLADNGPLMPTDSNVFRRYTFLEGVQQVNGSGPNRFGKYKSAYMNRAFPPAQVSALWTWLQKVPAGLPASDMAASLCQINSYGGKINTVASGTTAIPQRSSYMKLQYQTYWDNSSFVGQDDPVQAKAHIDWINGMYSDVYSAYGGFPDPRRDPTGTVDGCYFNYCDTALGVNGTPGISNAMYLYFKDNFTPLQNIKRKYNPLDWFRSAQSIPLS